MYTLTTEVKLKDNCGQFKSSEVYWTTVLDNLMVSLNGCATALTATNWITKPSEESAVYLFAAI